MLKGHMWKYDTIEMKKKTKKHLWDSNPRIMAKINVCSAGSDSIFWVKQDDIKQFSKLHLTAEYASLLFWFQCFQTSKCKQGH